MSDTAMEKNTRRAVDQLLLEQGRYTPLELLLLEGRLSYVDYEAWRAGKRRPDAPARRQDPRSMNKAG